MNIIEFSIALLCFGALLLMRYLERKLQPVQIAAQASCRADDYACLKAPDDSGL